ncbi:ribonuclease III [Thiohalorhabdus methylotrophus]|uniref:Ribonuclease 3 n=1 Tax=Thiohalorhabdus methylotrophus TaxID=3242694 RepID=A0ABV4TYP5_9GAMM
MDEASLQARIGYSFRETDLLRRALTHRSAGTQNNERQEFLGDAALNFTVARWLYERFPKEREGVLSRLRARLVCTEALAEIAEELELGRLVYLGPGERKAGGHRRESILADSVEALVGAVLLDGGVEAMQSMVYRLWESRVTNLDPRSVNKDPKTRLQEHLQSQGQPLPEYQLVETVGAEHQRLFYIECTVIGHEPVRGEGSSKRRAEQEAAQRMLDFMGVEYE